MFRERRAHSWRLRVPQAGMTIDPKASRFVRAGPSARPAVLDRESWACRPVGSTFLLEPSAGPREPGDGSCFPGHWRVGFAEEDCSSGH